MDYWKIVKELSSVFSYERVLIEQFFDANVRIFVFHSHFMKYLKSSNPWLFT